VCRLVYANPRWKADFLFGRYTEEYWHLYREKLANRLSDAEANRERNAFYLWTLEPAFESGTLLDVGCATGQFLMAAKAKGWRVHGVETSPISARIAKDTTGGEIYVGTLDTAPIQEGYFDAITMFDVIEHLQSPARYVERIARLLRPGGLLALSTPNIHSLSFRLLGRSWDVVGPNDHLYYFAPRTLQRLLVDCGFAIHSMRSEAIDTAVWARLLRFRALLPLARRLPKWTSSVVTRLMVGDSIYVVARHTGK
jgi:SAM-dependent methyltransferase